MKKLFVAVLFFFLLISCGGGGGGDSPPSLVTPVNQSVVGSYRFTGFTVKYQGDIITQDHPSVKSWSGSMQVTSTTLTQHFNINGLEINVGGKYTLVWDVGHNSGVAKINDGGKQFDIIFICSGLNLTTYEKGPDFEEWDYWVKISN